MSLIDYWDAAETTEVMNVNPGVHLGCTRFLADKPVRVSVLYVAEYLHGYFRKL